MRGRDNKPESVDRWERKDWWGVTLEAPDPGRLLRFWSATCSTCRSTTSRDDGGLPRLRPGGRLPGHPEGRGLRAARLASGSGQAGHAAAPGLRGRRPGRRHRARDRARGDVGRAPAAGRRPGDARPGRSPVLPLCVTWFEARWRLVINHRRFRGASLLKPASEPSSASTLARARASQCSRAWAVWNNDGFASRSRSTAARPARNRSSGTWAYSRRTSATYSA